MSLARSLIALGLLASTQVGNASLEDNGVWTAGIWDPGVWADGVWYETAPADPPSPVTGTNPHKHSFKFGPWR